MPLNSDILKGSTTLDGILNGGPSLKPGVAGQDVDAVRRVQRALVALGFPLPKSFKGGPSAPPDGVYGGETSQAVMAFQRRQFPGSSIEWDGRVGKKTLGKMDPLLPASGVTPTPVAPVVPTAVPFVCGPDVTDQAVAMWTQIQTDFNGWSFKQRFSACNKILIPMKSPESPLDFPTNLEELKRQLQLFADIDGWDTLPLYQGASIWLRTPPIYDDAIKGPCATPSSKDFANPDPFADGHESDETCSDTVQIGGKCWLNGSVNYGTFGVMVRLCSDFAANNPILSVLGAVRTVYSLDWAKTLIRAYKVFGPHPEKRIVPLAWTEATFNLGPKGLPTIPGDRPKCACTCSSKGDVVDWDYIWKPIKQEGREPVPRPKKP